METPVTKVTILSLPSAANVVEELRTGRGGGSAGVAPSAVLVAGPDAAPSAVLVAGPDAAAVGEAVAGLRAAGIPAAGWVGDSSDPAVREMAAELFPGSEIVAGC